MEDDLYQVGKLLFCNNDNARLVDVKGIHRTGAGNRLRTKIGQLCTVKYACYNRRPPECLVYFDDGYSHWVRPSRLEKI